MAEFYIIHDFEIDFGDAGTHSVHCEDDVEVHDDDVLEYAREHLIDWDEEFEELLCNKSDDELFELVASRLGLEK